MRSYQHTVFKILAAACLLTLAAVAIFHIGSNPAEYAGGRAPSNHAVPIVYTIPDPARPAPGGVPVRV